MYFGHGAYGVQAAARTYFDRDAKDLTLLQSATLAGLIAAPSARDPFEHPEEARRYRNFVLDRMVEVGSIDAETARSGCRPGRSGSPRSRRCDRRPRYFMEHVRRDLKASYGLDALYRGGLRVRTTLDMEWQRAAERAIRAYLPAPNDPEAALVAIDPRTGAIRAMVGGRSFEQERVQSRDPGTAPGRERVQAVRPPRGARAGDLAARGPERPVLDDDPGSVLRDEREAVDGHERGRSVGGHDVAWRTRWPAP